MKKVLDFFNTALSQVYDLILLSDDVVSGLFLLDSHDGIHFGILWEIGSTLHLSDKYVAHLIELCGLSALSGNDKRGSGFIDKY